MKKELSTTAISAPLEHHDLEQVFFTQDSAVSCDGGGAGLGHPRVFLKVKSDTSTPCPYCSRAYQKKNIANPL